MNQALQVLLSNRVELLYEELKNQLFSEGTGAFTHRMIIVPSPAMKSWLMLRMAQDPSLNIACGLEISCLDQSILKLKHLLGGSSDLALPSQIELSLAIESILKAQQDRWESLQQYLSSPGKRGERRRIGLAKRLGQLFHLYSIYGGEMLAELDGSDGWQKSIWQSLFGENGPYRSLYHALSSFQVKKRIDLQVHVFSLSFLPALHHRFLTQLAETFPVHYYVLSPCQAFWSDIRSDRERQQIQAYWEKRGASLEQQLALEEYLRDHNPLLANFGRLGREMALQIEESATLTAESYAIHAEAAEMPVYAEQLTPEITVEDTQQPFTLLSAIQADMVVLRNPSQENRLSFPAYDYSIQVHAAHSHMREVEILYSLLIGLIQKESIHPSDIIVMAPNIEEYAPFIKAVFESLESQLDVQIMDLAVPSQSAYVQGLLQLLALPTTRLEASAIIQLFENAAFQKRHHFKPEDLHTFREWIQEAGVLWAGDAHHRAEILQREHCHQPIVDNHPIGTWEYGIKRLVSGLAFQEREFETTQADLLGEWIKLLRSLRKDLEVIVNGSFTIEEWITRLSLLLEAYLSPSSEETEGPKAIQSLWEHLREAAKKLGDTAFSFTAIYDQIETTLQKEHICYREPQLHAVRFCSMLPMRTLPAKVIALLGMHEGAFPKQEMSHALNLMHENSKADYCPSQVDFDRFLFLETILSTRQYLLLLYQGYSLTDFKEQSPSLLVTELLNYLDSAFEIDSKPISHYCVHHHPAFSYHASYFQKGTAFPSFLHAHYKMACAYYQENKKPIHRFIPCFVKAKKESEVPSTIELKTLISVAKDPLKHYMNKALKIYLSEAEDRLVQDEELFEMTPLELSKIKKAALKKPLDRVIQEYEKNGTMPLGTFKHLALEKIHEQNALLKSYLNKAGVSPGDIYSIEFSDRYERPFQTEKGDWKTPPIYIQDETGKVCKIVGVLKEVSSEGLIEHLDNKNSEISKAWPQFLALGCLIDQFQLPIKHRLILTKKGGVKEAFFSDSDQRLSEFAAYSEKCVLTPSPLAPKWVPAILTMDSPDQFREKMEKELRDTFMPSYDRYLNWLIRGTDIPDADSLFQYWKDTARQLYEPLLQNWYPKTARKE